MPLKWQRLVWLEEEELGRLDIAAVNLACADGLPGAPTTEQAAECLRMLDHYARCVEHYTQRCLPDFHARPRHYDGSLGKFRMICLLRLLQTQFGIRYNEAKIPLDVPLHTPDTFIHGALRGDGGTCASLPVIYAAVGRRLSYPLRLVTATGKGVGHLFVRWDEPGVERFNFEANNQSCDTPPDDHYRGLYGGMSPEAERFGLHLLSQSPRQELSGFLMGRGFLWLDTGRWRQAANSFAWAWSLSPGNKNVKNRLIGTMNAWGQSLRAREPRGFPPLFLTKPPPRRRFPETLPADFERDILALEAEENVLNNPDLEAQLWGPMRRGEPVRQPSFARVVPLPEGGLEIGLSFETFHHVVTT